MESKHLSKPQPQKPKISVAKDSNISDLKDRVDENAKTEKF